MTKRIGFFCGVCILTFITCWSIAAIWRFHAYNVAVAKEAAHWKAQQEQ